MKITYPIFGKYTSLFKEMFEELGLDVLVPNKINNDMIKWGCKNSSDMMCYPYKVTLGNFKNSLDRGADILLMFDSGGLCRFRHYWILQDAELKKYKKNFKMIPLNLSGINQFKKLNKKLSYLKIIIVLMKYWKKVQILDRQFMNDKKINIGIIGEIYTCLEPGTNFDIENKLKKYNVNIYNTVTLSKFIKSSLEKIFKIYPTKQKWKRQARKYLNGDLGGHGFENIYETLWLKDQNINGIIHLLPLSCMPETTIEPILNDICQESNIPLLRLPIDESNSEANLNTRIETFIELIKRKRECIHI